MKKKLIATILTLSLILSFALTACGGGNNGGTHTHTWAAEWSGDAGYHWHECTDTDCADVSDKAAHNWDNGVILSGDEATASAEGTKTFTCQTCDRTKTERVPELEPLAAALIYGYEIGSIFPVSLYDGQTLSDVGDEYYAYGDWNTPELELYEGVMPQIPAKYALRSDIPQLVEDNEGDYAYTYVDEFYTYYHYIDGYMYYSFVDGAACDEISIWSYQPDGDSYDVSYYIFGDVLITRINYYEYTSDTDFEWTIIKNGAVTKSYTYSDFVEFSDNQIVNQAFIDNYSYNGVMFLYSYVQTLKPEYVRVKLSDGDIASYQYKQAGQQPDYSAFDKPGYAAVYSYSVYSETDASTLPFDITLLNAEKIALYSTFMTGDPAIVYLDENFEEINGGNIYLHEFYIIISGTVNSFHLYVNNDGSTKSYDLKCWVTEGVITELNGTYYNYNTYDYYDCDFAYNAAADAFRAFIKEESFGIDVTITQNIFDTYRALGYTLEISVDYMPAEYVRYLYLFGGDFDYAYINLPEYMNDSPLWVWEGDRVSEVFEFLEEKGFTTDGYLRYIPCAYDPSLYGKTVVMIYNGQVLLFKGNDLAYYFDIAGDSIYTDEYFFEEEIPGAIYTASVEVYSALECLWEFEDESDRSGEFKDILLASGEWEISDSDTYDDDPQTPYTTVWIYGNICVIRHTASDGASTVFYLNRI